MGLPNPSRKTKFSDENGDRKIFHFPVQLTTSRLATGEMSRLTRDGFAEPVSQDQILRREISFSCSADHEQIGHLPRSILTLAICDDHTYTCHVPLQLHAVT